MYRKSFSLLFYRAVRDLKPVWMLEDIRTMETFHLGEDSGQRIYTPSEALLYAIVHDHRSYARFLLRRYTDEALAKPAERLCSYPSSHVTMAIRYDRRHILSLIVQESRGTSLSHTDRCGRTPLHLACELLRPEALTVLLGGGACPQVRDQLGVTPLDVLLERLAESKEADGGEARRCLDNLLVFMPTVLHFETKGHLLREPARWTPLLGEETYSFLAGKRPAPLVQSAMRTVLQQLDPDSFSVSLHQLPIPPSLKPCLI